MSEHHPDVARRTLEGVLADTSVGAVAVATPIATHAKIGRAVLGAGKHLLIEKPMAADEAEARTLVDLAAAKQLTLVTGYVSLYHPCYRELAKLLAGRAIKSARLIWKKQGTFEEAVELNLLTHDLSIALGLFGEPSSARTLRREGSVTEADILETELRYPNDVTVSSSIDRTSNERQRLIEVVTADDETITWDGPALRLRAKDGAEREIFRDKRQPLAIEVGEFLAAIKGGSVPPTAGDFGARVLAVHATIQGLQ